MVTAAVSVHNQIRELRELDSVKAVNELLADPRWVYLGSSVVSRVSRYSATGEPVVVGEKAMIQSTRRVIYHLGRLPEGGTLPG